MRNRPVEEDLALRNRMQQMVTATKQRRGYRPLTHALHREGFPVNHKRGWPERAMKRMADLRAVGELPPKSAR